jgi:hypothetical protein
MISISEILIWLLTLALLGTGGAFALKEAEQFMKEQAISAHREGLTKIGDFQRRLNGSN